MSKGLVEVLGVAAPEVVENVAPVIYDAITSGPKWLTKRKIKEIISDVQLETVKIHALKKLTYEEDSLLNFYVSQFAASIAILKSQQLPEDMMEEAIKLAWTRYLNRCTSTDILSGFRSKYNGM